MNGAATSPLTDLGATGLLALLLLREVFAFLKARRQNGSGDKSVEFWTEKIREIIRAELKEAFDQWASVLSQSQTLRSHRKHRNS